MNTAFYFKMKTIAIEYKPDSGIVLGDSYISWGTSREKIRETLKSEHQNNDQEFGDFFLRRDIYNELQGQTVLLFFNYDNNDHFSELEIHKGVELTILDKTINFEMQFWDAVETLDKISSKQKIVDEGETLFIDLKLSICSCASMGGDQEDNHLSYIYCAQKINHLLE